MNWSLRSIRARQIERELSELGKIVMPKNGWVRTIRETLGMSARQLGERSCVTSERIIKIEHDEISGRTTVATLEKMARAMNCRMIYGFVPNDGLVEFIKKTAEEKASTQLKVISHHMELEDQKVNSESTKQQLEILKDEMIHGNIKKIWDK